MPFLGFYIYEIDETESRHPSFVGQGIFGQLGHFLSKSVDVGKKSGNVLWIMQNTSVLLFNSLFSRLVTRF